MSESILSAHELDALRNAVDEGMGSARAGADGPEGLPRLKWGEGRAVSGGREDRLSWVMDRAALQLERRMSDLLERSSGVQITWLESTRFAAFKDTCELDGREVAILPFSLTGLGGRGLVTVDPELVERVVEGLMGGGTSAANNGTGRTLSGLDLRVTRRWVQRFLDDLGIAWNSQDPLRLAVGTTDGSAAARSYGDNTPVVAALFEVALEGKPAGLVGVVLPRAALDALGEEAGEPTRAKSAATVIPNGPFVNAVPDCPVHVEVMIGRVRLRVRELLALNPGDTLWLDPPQTPTVLVQGVPKFQGTPGTRGERKAVLIDDLYEGDDHA